MHGSQLKWSPPYQSRWRVASSSVGSEEAGPFKRCPPSGQSCLCKLRGAHDPHHPANDHDRRWSRRRAGRPVGRPASQSTGKNSIYEITQCPAHKSSIAESPGRRTGNWSREAFVLHPARSRHIKPVHRIRVFMCYAPSTIWIYHLRTVGPQGGCSSLF